MADVKITGDLEINSPEWWFRRLLTRLKTRAIECDEYWRFYEGEQPLMFASQKFREVFGQRYPHITANFMPLVIDAERERLIVQGFRFANRPQGDDATWRIWQENQMDAESQIAHEIALAKGESYVMVSPKEAGDDYPLITIEDPSEVIVETAPGNRRKRLAALKVFINDDGKAQAYLYLPDKIYRFVSRNAQKGSVYSGLSTTAWETMDDTTGVEQPNPLGVVPIIPLINRPRRDGRGRSELRPVMGNQSAINKLRFDALVASEYIAFPQRYAINIDIPVDPDTGAPIAPFKPGVDILWAVRRPTAEEVAEYGDKVPPVTLGQFPQADMSPYIDMIHAEIGEMASNSRTPYHYLLGEPQSVPPSGESLKSSEAPLVKKVMAQEVHFGEGWEEVMRLALTAAGQKAKARTDGETIWKDAETRNEAARTDSVLKQFAAGLLPDVFALEELGYSQSQIERIKSMGTPTPDMPATVAPPKQKVI
jgi:hypothetical protein